VFIFLRQEADSSYLPSPSENNSKEIYTVELVKEDGTFGISVTASVTVNLPVCQSNCDVTKKHIGKCFYVEQREKIG